jgi:hypothetical protein
VANFLVRVELHGATWPDDYDALHKAMARAGFDHRLLADDGKYYRLPTAEYAVSGNHTIEAVRKAAREAANSTGRLNAVLVVEFLTWLSNGLVPDE